MLRTLYLIACLLLCFPALAQGPGGYRVIDGDTIEAPFGVKCQLIGFDAPEIFHSKCDAELELGMVAKERLEDGNESYGLTTLCRRHVDIHGTRVEFDFIGKGGKRHLVALTDRSAVRIIRQLQELPGQELFQYLDEDGNARTLGARRTSMPICTRSPAITLPPRISGRGAAPFGPPGRSLRSKHSAARSNCAGISAPR